MKNAFLPVALALLSTACASPGPQLDGCAGLGKSKSVTVSYGDGWIDVTPKVKMKQKSVFVIKLKPKSKEYYNKLVTIEGKSVTPGGAGVSPPSWLDTSDTYNTRKKFVYCTPGTPSETTQVYKYSVEVGPGLLYVDPRIDVTH